MKMTIIAASIAMMIHTIKPVLEDDVVVPVSVVDTVGAEVVGIIVFIAVLTGVVLTTGVVLAANVVFSAGFVATAGANTA